MILLLFVVFGIAVFVGLLLAVVLVAIGVGADAVLVFLLVAALSMRGIIRR